jgi:predicted ATPase
LEVTTNALNEPETSGIAAGLARIYRLQGELLLTQVPPDRHAAQASFTSSLEIARQQGAHTLELRAAISLAKLWQAERPDEARRLLADTCAWFSKGWETPDWQEAQALLKHISLASRF